MAFQPILHKKIQAKKCDSPMSSASKILPKTWFVFRCFSETWRTPLLSSSARASPWLSVTIWGLHNYNSLHTHDASMGLIWGFPKMVGFTPKSSILTGFSKINHPFWGTPIFGNIHMFTWMAVFFLVHVGKYIMHRSWFELKLTWKQMLVSLLVFRAVSGFAIITWNNPKK